MHLNALGLTLDLFFFFFSQRLQALVCTALTKPLVLLIERFSSDKSDAYTFAVEEKQVH